MRIRDDGGWGEDIDHRDEVDTFDVYFVGRTTGIQKEIDVRNNKKGSIRDCSYVSNLNKAWIILHLLG